MAENHYHILSYEDKNNLVQFLLQSATNNKPAVGKIGEAASTFGVSRRTVTNLWSTAKKQLIQGKAVQITSNRLGLKYKKAAIDQDLLQSIEIKNRGTIRDLAVAMNCSKQRVCRWLKEGAIKPHTNAIKLILTDLNKIHRLEYSLSHLHLERECGKIRFSEMRDVIHIDEKWFYLTTVSLRYYRGKDEDGVYRACKSKRYITKVMFLCAVGRPHYNTDGTLLWDGKVGIFPFTEQVPAKKKSKNRPKGTLETKNVKSITKAVTKAIIINEVIPKIKALWPASASKHIFIQQDNAKPHIPNNDPEFREIASSDGFNIQLLCQPANSPDTNINDLGFFRSIQSLQQKNKTTIIDGLLKNVEDAFSELTDVVLNKLFLSLQSCCIEILKVRGGNNYKLPHMGKDRMLREQTLPEALEVDEVIVRESLEYLRMLETGEDRAFDFGRIMRDLGY